MKYTLEISYHWRAPHIQIDMNGTVIGASTLKGALRQVVQRIVAQEDADRDVIKEST